MVMPFPKTSPAAPSTPATTTPLGSSQDPLQQPSATPELPPQPTTPIGNRTVISCQNSSMVHSFEYDGAERILRVYFKGGQIYDYFFVPQEVAEEFRRVCEDPVESAGRWFAKTVRNVFNYQKVN